MSFFVGVYRSEVGEAGRKRECLYACLSLLATLGALGVVDVAVCCKGGKGSRRHKVGMTEYEWVASWGGTIRSNRSVGRSILIDRSFSRVPLAVTTFLWLPTFAGAAASRGLLVFGRSFVRQRTSRNRLNHRLASGAI
jgi:hypothetical protein